MRISEFSRLISHYETICSNSAVKHIRLFTIHTHLENEFKGSSFVVSTERKEQLEHMLQIVKESLNRDQIAQADFKKEISKSISYMDEKHSHNIRILTDIENLIATLKTEEEIIPSKL
ncbi:MAG TPA: hypothetical protein VLG44_05590 [Chlamydiales bacterium]|nr:hypothetical protein [Chlamydiales bacterium]